MILKTISLLDGISQLINMVKMLTLIMEAQHLLPKELILKLLPIHNNHRLEVITTHKLLFLHPRLFLHRLSLLKLQAPHKPILHKDRKLDHPLILLRNQRATHPKANPHLKAQSQALKVVEMLLLPQEVNLLPRPNKYNQVLWKRTLSVLTRKKMPHRVQLKKII